MLKGKSVILGCKYLMRILAKPFKCFVLYLLLIHVLLAALAVVVVVAAAVAVGALNDIKIQLYPKIIKLKIKLRRGT